MDGSLVSMMNSEGVWMPWKEGEARLDPTLRLNRHVAHVFLQAAVEEAGKAGVKPDSEARISGKLEATRYHLEDLRALLKLQRLQPIDWEVVKNGRES